MKKCLYAVLVGSYLSLLTSCGHLEPKYQQDFGNYRLSYSEGSKSRIPFMSKPDRLEIYNKWDSSIRIIIDNNRDGIIGNDKGDRYIEIWGNVKINYHTGLKKDERVAKKLLQINTFYQRITRDLKDIYTRGKKLAKQREALKKFYDGVNLDVKKKFERGISELESKLKE